MIVDDNELTLWYRVSLAKVLLTAIPESLRQIAATNVPAVSSILWEEFLDDKRPDWFLELPWDIQSYLIERFGPATAVPNPTGPAFSSETGLQSSQLLETSHPIETDQPSSTPTSEELQSSTASASSGSADMSSSMVTVSTPTGSDSISIDPTFSPTRAGSTNSPTSTAELISSNQSGLTKQQKIGIGVGVPFGIAGAAALLFGCCLLYRRHQKKNVNGSVPPSSPGFIPRFAFQEKAIEDPEQQHPLNRGSQNSFADLANMAWDEEVVDTSSSGESVPTLNNPAQTQPQQQNIMAPALFHTHSSNRARGKRTSYTSLHSVAEVTEPDENETGDLAESPILGRHNAATSPPTSPTRYIPQRSSPHRNLIPPPVTAVSNIKRKPVPGNNGYSPAAQLASQSLLRQTMPEHASSSRSTQQLQPQNRGIFGNHTQVTSATSPYVSPIEERNHNNPFRNNYDSYEEDYGPEYSHAHLHNRSNSHDSDFYLEDGIHGGHTDLSRYPTLERRSPKMARTEWPLRNFSPGHKRNKSPLWDRVYDG